jgi:hypothetical protein
MLGKHKGMNLLIISLLFFPLEAPSMSSLNRCWDNSHLFANKTTTKRFPTKCARNLPFNQKHQFFHSFPTHVVLDKMIMNVKRRQTCGQHSRCNIYRSTHMGHNTTKFPTNCEGRRTQSVMAQNGKLSRVVTPSNFIVNTRANKLIASVIYIM